MVFTPEEVRLDSPKSLALVELRQSGLGIFRKIYRPCYSNWRQCPGWEISYAREFDMTNDSKHFRGETVGNGRNVRYRPDVFGTVDRVGRGYCNPVVPRSHDSPF